MRKSKFNTDQTEAHLKRSDSKAVLVSIQPRFHFPLYFYWAEKRFPLKACQKANINISAKCKRTVGRLRFSETRHRLCACAVAKQPWYCQQRSASQNPLKTDRAFSCTLNSNSNGFSCEEKRLYLPK